MNIWSKSVFFEPYYVFHFLSDPIFYVIEMDEINDPYAGFNIPNTIFVYKKILTGLIKTVDSFYFLF